MSLKPATFPRGSDGRQIIYILITLMKDDFSDDEPRFPDHFFTYSTSKLENIFHDLKKSDLEHHIEKIKDFMAEYDGGLSGRADVLGGKDFGKASCILDEETRFFIDYLDDEIKQEAEPIIVKQDAAPKVIKFPRD